MTAARRTGDNGHSHSAAAPATHPHAEPQDAPKTNIDSSESKAYHVSHGAHGNSDAPALHDKHAGHSVEMFRRKFWGTVLLSVPTLVWAPMIQQWLGYEAWGGPDVSRWISAFFGMLVFHYGGSVFINGAIGGLCEASPRNPFGVNDLKRWRRSSMVQEVADEMFRWIVDAMPEGVVYSDRDGIIRLWNRGAEAIFGYRPEDALGQTLDLIIPERWRGRHWEGYRTVMRTGVTRYGREVLAVPASRSDGARISIEFSIMLPTDRDGQVLGAVAIVRDVTTRWEQEQLLRKRLARLEAAKRATDSSNET